MSHAPRGRLAVGGVLCLLAAPVAVEGLAPLLAVWAGVPLHAVAVAAAALAPVLLAGLVALVRGAAAPWVGALAGLLAALAAAFAAASPAPAILGAAIGGAIAAFGLPLAAARAPVPRGRVAAVFWAILAALTVVQVARMSVFMADPTQVWGTFAPDNKFAREHCCFSSYVHGAALARRGDANIYDDRYGFEAAEDVPELPSAIDVRPLTMDTYEYPPLFLPVPRLLLALTDEFLALRALWFLITAAIFAAVARELARWLGGDATRRAGLLALALWLAPPTLITAYTGNLQLAAMACSALAMVWITGGRTRRGAALLAFMVGAKIFPGVLVVWLLATRRFAAAAWTAAFGALYTLLALALVGTRPFVDFFTYHLPRIASGETFGFLTQPRSIATNLGLFGLPFKLRAVLGWPAAEADAWQLARQLSWAFTLLVLAVAALAGLRARPPASPRERALQAGSWFALLALGALRSPFAPPGLLVPLVWGLSLQAAASASPRETLRAAILWILVLVVIPAPSPAGIAYSLACQLFVVGLALRMALRRG